MQTLIKDVVSDKRVANVLESNGLVYVGQLLILRRGELMSLNNVGPKGVQSVVTSLAKHKYPTMGSVKAHELPSTVLLHMAELSAQREAAEAAAEEEFIKLHGCTMREFWASRSADWGFAPDDEEYYD